MSKTPKFCWGCGANLKEGQKFCTRCGKPVKFEKSDNGYTKKISSPPKTTQPTPPYQKPVAQTQPNRGDYQSSFSSIQNSPKNSQPFPNYPTQYDNPSPHRMNPHKDREKNEPTNTEINHSPTAPVQPTIPVKSLKEISELNESLHKLDFEKRFKAIEYKINAINVENEILDLENKIDDLKLSMTPVEPVKIPENLATTDDLKSIQTRLDEINLDKLEQLDKLENLDHLEKIDLLDEKLKSLDQKMGNLESAEKISNLAKNTVTRLNKVEKRLNEFNIETRQRITKLDNRVEEIGTKMEHVNQAVDAILPALLKLTEKVNQLNTQSKINKIKAGKKTVSEKASKISQDLDLPPFPSAKASKSEQKAKDEKTKVKPGM